MAPRFLPTYRAHSSLKAFAMLALAAGLDGLLLGLLAGHAASATRDLLPMVLCVSIAVSALAIFSALRFAHRVARRGMRYRSVGFRQFVSALLLPLLGIVALGPLTGLLCLGLLAIARTGVATGTDGALYSLVYLVGFMAVCGTLCYQSFRKFLRLIA